MALCNVCVKSMSKQPTGLQYSEIWNKFTVFLWASCLKRLCPVKLCEHVMLSAKATRKASAPVLMFQLLSLFVCQLWDKAAFGSAEVDKAIQGELLDKERGHRRRMQKKRNKNYKGTWQGHSSASANANANALSCNFKWSRTTPPRHIPTLLDV